MNTKLTVNDIRQLKGKRKITLLTAYDYPMASLIDKAGIDIILVGDSVANVVLGLESTREMTLEQMLYHAKAVRRAVKRAFLVGDMPFESYQTDVLSSAKNAGRFMNEAGCDAVKLEWFDQAVECSGKIISAGIPLMGHIGLTPQTADKLGGFKVQGKDSEAAKRLIDQAKQLESAGCFSLILECVPDKVSEIITKSVNIPTIGIGAGACCDGQALVTHDMLGLFERYTPKFVKRYASLSGSMLEAFEKYKQEVQEGVFPSKEYSFSISPEELKKISGS